MNDRALVGRTIREIVLEGDDLRFKTDAGTVLWTAHGDCCSHSAFSDVPEVGSPSKVVDITAIEAMVDPRLAPATLGPSPFEYEEVVEIYGWMLRLEDGRELRIIMRNNSNGYYGGWFTESVHPMTVPPVEPRKEGDQKECSKCRGKGVVKGECCPRCHGHGFILVLDLMLALKDALAKRPLSRQDLEAENSRLKAERADRNYRP